MSFENLQNQNQETGRQVDNQINDFALRNKLQAALMARYLDFTSDQREVAEGEWVSHQAKSFSDLYDQIKIKRPDLINKLSRLAFLGPKDLKMAQFTEEENSALDELAKILYEKGSEFNK